MKRILHIIFMTLCCAFLHAQTMSVSSFALDEADLTANLKGTTVLDQNGGKCALIRIQTTQKGFTFDVGSLGVQKVDYSNVGEVWLYVPAGVKRMGIRHPQLGTLSGYAFPVNITAGRTYVMQLVTGNVHTIVEQDDGKTYFSMTVTPANAVVMVDDVLQTLDANGSLVMRMNRGEHKYSVQAQGYTADRGTFTLGMQKVSKNITLQSVMAQLTLSCATPGASLYVNDVLKASGSWTGALTAGDYLLEARKEGYYSQKQSVTLTEREQKSVTLPELFARTGMLDVNYNPVDCDVYIDNVKVGTSPDVFKNVLVGTHKVQLRKEGYSAKTETVTITEGKTTSLVGSLEKAAQGGLSSKSNDGKVYDVVEQMPSYPGGMGTLMQFLNTTIKYPALAEESGKQGRVLCSFIVECDGSITDLKVTKSVDSSLDKEACRVISAMPRWNPGKQGGKAVRVRYTLPITFRLK